MTREYYTNTLDIVIQELIDSLTAKQSDPHGMVRYGTVRYGTARNGTARHGTARHGTVRYGAVRCGAVRCGTVRYGTVRYGTVRYGNNTFIIKQNYNISYCGNGAAYKYGTVEPHLTVTSLVRKPPNYSHPGSVPNYIPPYK